MLNWMTCITVRGKDIKHLNKGCSSSATVGGKRFFEGDSFSSCEVRREPCEVRRALRILFADPPKLPPPLYTILA